MLRHIVSETSRDGARQTLPGQPVTNVGEQRPAANASRWIHGNGQARRLRRLRRMERSVPSHMHGWMVRTW